MPITELNWKALTRTVNEVKSPNRFLQRMVFNRVETFPTETVEYSELTGARDAAPFVMRDSEALMISGTATKFQQVMTPNIRIKRPFTPSEVLFGRQPGTIVYESRGGIRAAVQRHIARDMAYMADTITNTEEYLCALALQGTISYSVDTQDAFTVTYPRPSGNNITLSTFWDDATPADTTPLADIHAVKRVLSDEVGMAPTDAILGQEAADAILALAEGDHVKLIKSDSGVEAGGLTLLTQFQEEGAIFLGSLGGVRLWEYSRTANVNGSATNMIRPKYAEFVCRAPAAEYWMWYGAIPDLQAFQGNMLQARRFAKSWDVQDPSSIMALTHSRPLPVTKRPGAIVSVKVVSG